MLWRNSRERERERKHGWENRMWIVEGFFRQVSKWMCVCHVDKLYIIECELSVFMSTQEVEGSVTPGEKNRDTESGLATETLCEHFFFHFDTTPCTTTVHTMIQFNLSFFSFFFLLNFLLLLVLHQPNIMKSQAEVQCRAKKISR